MDAQLLRLGHHGCSIEQTHLVFMPCLLFLPCPSCLLNKESLALHDWKVTCLESDVLIYVLIFLLISLYFAFFFSEACLESDVLICVLCFAGVGGYTYLMEPLWWIGMIISEILLF